MQEPFSRVILDCVGPLPTNNIWTCLPAYAYVREYSLSGGGTAALTKSEGCGEGFDYVLFNFGFPQVIQTDQGTNFMSRLFKQVLSQLNIKHVTSSAYHPESQGVLERFHQTLKAMFSKYCAESGKGWDEGLPLLLFAVRETVQESLGFSPADLVFGHTVRGPLKMLKENWLSEQKPECNLLDYVSSFRGAIV